MDDHVAERDEPLLDPVDLPKSGGNEALEWITRMKGQPARFGCLGLGCLPWLAILVAAIVLWLVLR